MAGHDMKMSSTSHAEISEVVTPCDDQLTKAFVVHDAIYTLRVLWMRYLMKRL